MNNDNEGTFPGMTLIAQIPRISRLPFRPLHLLLQTCGPGSDLGQELLPPLSHWVSVTTRDRGMLNVTTPEILSPEAPVLELEAPSPTAQRRPSQYLNSELLRLRFRSSREPRGQDPQVSPQLSISSKCIKA